MTQTQRQYFDNMVPGQILRVDSVKNPSILIEAAKEYIDSKPSSGSLTFSEDYTTLHKQFPIPATDIINIILHGN